MEGYQDTEVTSELTESHTPRHEAVRKSIFPRTGRSIRRPMWSCRTRLSLVQEKDKDK